MLPNLISQNINFSYMFMTRYETRHVMCVSLSIIYQCVVDGFENLVVCYKCYYTYYYYIGNIT